MQDQAALNILDGADVRRALAGDQAAFAALYNRYFNRVYDFLARMLRDRAAAEDVTQETFIQAMTALKSLKKPEGFKSWLFTIARNQALNRLERGKRVVAMPTTITDDGEELTLDLVDEDRQADPALPVLDQELASLVWEAARGLDERSYSILDLHVRQGLDSGEIAEALGVTKGNAYTMLSRVKDRFEESLAVLIVSRRGRQECDILQSIVADVTRFTAEVRDQVGKHIKACEICTATRRKVVVPFNIISGLAAPLPPVGLKERIWDDLMAQWPPTGAESAAPRPGRDAARMRRWWATVRRRWPLSVGALLLLVLGILTSLGIVLGDSASPAPATPAPPTATIAPPTQTPIPPTVTPAPPTPAPTATIQAIVPVLVLPTPVPTATPLPAPVDTPMPPTETPADTPAPPTKVPPTSAPATKPASSPTEMPIPPPAPVAPADTPVPPTDVPPTALPPPRLPRRCPACRYSCPPSQQRLSHPSRPRCRPTRSNSRRPQIPPSRRRLPPIHPCRYLRRRIRRSPRRPRRLRPFRLRWLPRSFPRVPHGSEPGAHSPSRIRAGSR